MNGDYDPVDTMAGPPRRSLLRPLLVPAIAFLLGLGAMGYILAHWEGAARIVGIAHRTEPHPTPQSAPPPSVGTTAPAPAPARAEPAAAPADEPERILIDPEIG